VTVTDQHRSPTAQAAHDEIDTVAERLHALEVTAARLAEERDEARRERDIAKANARVSDEMTSAMSRDLYDANTELRHAKNAATDIANAVAAGLLREERLAAENTQLRNDVAGLEALRKAVAEHAPRGWRWRRR
jgi:hypothetical protein